MSVFDLPLGDLRASFDAEEKRARERRHATRFHRWADRHDRRIPHAVRVAVLTRANEHCERCSVFVSGYSSAQCLEMHHLNYERAYGDELPEDLKMLCRGCHAQTHGRL
jgi:5-methylcytosine-specific restriction endonuclease McrA